MEPNNIPVWQMYGLPQLQGFNQSLIDPSGLGMSQAQGQPLGKGQSKSVSQTAGDISKIAKAADMNGTAQTMNGLSTLAGGGAKTSILGDLLKALVAI